jgi:hypothetical protein
MNNAPEIMTKVEDYLLHAVSTSIIPHQVDCCLANNSTTAPANADNTLPLNANATARANTNTTPTLNADPTAPPLNANVTNTSCPSLTTEDGIRHTCKDVLKYLLLWDNFLSLVHTEYPTSVDCDKAQDCIDEIVELADSMGMSRSIKMHVCKDHLVSQMRRFECGLSDFDENFMEQYHQTGAKLDNKYKSVSADRQADARSSSF